MLPHRSGFVQPAALGAVVTLMLAGASGTLKQGKPARDAREAPQPDEPARDVPKIPASDPRAALLPAGYRAEVAFQRLMYPSSIEFDDAGNIYIAESGYVPGDGTQPARILRARPGSRATPEVVARGFAAPITDLLWHAGKLYVSHRGKISVLEGTEFKNLVTGLPSDGDHSNNQLSFGPDGRLYFGQGSATNSGVVGEDDFACGWPKEHPQVCETSAFDVTLRGQAFESRDPRSPDEAARATTGAFQPFGTTVPAGTVVRGRNKANGAILRMNPDGSELEPYAWGFRNPYGVLWGPDQVLYASDAGSDERGSRPIANAPEKLWLVLRHAWYGWPDYEGGVPVTDPRFKPRDGPAPQFLLEQHPRVERPIMTFEPHASITQLEFGRSAAFGCAGDLFIAASGDQPAVTAGEEVRAGSWVKRVDLTTGEGYTFFGTRPDALGPEGLEYVATAGPKRLVDLRFSLHEDALYVVDSGPIHYAPGERGPEPVAFPGTGVVWRITRASETAGAETTGR